MDGGHIPTGPPRALGPPRVPHVVGGKRQRSPSPRRLPVGVPIDAGAVIEAARAPLLAEKARQRAAEVAAAAKADAVIEAARAPLLAKKFRQQAAEAQAAAEFEVGREECERRIRGRLRTLKAKDAAVPAERTAQEEAERQRLQEDSAVEARRRMEARVARAPTIASKHLKFCPAGQRPASFAVGVQSQAAYVKVATAAMPAHGIQAPRPSCAVFPPDWMGPKEVRAKPFQPSSASLRQVPSQPNRSVVTLNQADRRYPGDTKGGTTI